MNEIPGNGNNPQNQSGVVDPTISASTDLLQDLSNDGNNKIISGKEFEGSNSAGISMKNIEDYEEYFKSKGISPDDYGFYAFQSDPTRGVLVMDGSISQNNLFDEFVAKNKKIDGFWSNGCVSADKNLIIIKPFKDLGLRLKKIGVGDSVRLTEDKIKKLKDADKLFAFPTTEGEVELINEEFAAVKFGNFVTMINVKDLIKV